MKYRYIKKLLKFKSNKEKVPMFPRPTEYKDEVYAEILEDLYKYYVVSLRDMENQVVEDNEFMTAWVHEIKTPITTLKLLTDNVDNNGESLLSLQEEIDKIDDYVEKVLYYSRSDNFSKDYIISEVVLDSVVKESVKKHSIIFIRKHISFVNNVDSNMWVDTDRKWILFIVDQLISNALKYTNENPKPMVKVSTVENEREKILIVEDNGRGIKKEDIERLFTKAFTGSNGRNFNSKSTGMGLYLSQKLAKKLNHYITVESQYGKGTCAYVHFPKWEN
ncbi:sensor histidine kinase [Haloimpatiens lingqiaonensis]|uniref:sensor histidine kinase n=1 Tax=Haloimpatiens lingqiaonensis TaxID=1380675 RepID=UPI001FAA311E|nr:HAMP domain-containing sensor histidine kinase [Haloimpatiens lingqiaonensis]